MHRSFVLAAAIAVAVSPLFAQDKDKQDQVKTLRRDVARLTEQLVDERTKLLMDLRVNGKQLDPKEVMREAVYLTGGKLVEAKVSSFFILEELKKQVDSGQRKAEEFLVSDDDVATKLAPMKAEFETKNPGVDFWEVVRSQYGLSKDTFLEQQKRRATARLRQGADTAEAIIVEGEATLLGEVLTPRQLSLLDDIQQLVLGELGISFDLDDAATRAYLSAAGSNIVGITQTTRSAVQAALRRGANGPATRSCRDVREGRNAREFGPRPSLRESLSGATRRGCFRVLQPRENGLGRASI